MAKTETEYYEFCRYCGQQSLITVDIETEADIKNNGGNEAFEEYLKDQATFACNCSGAIVYTNVERRIEKAEKRCLDIAPTESVGNVMKLAIRPLMMEEMDKLTIKDGADTYTAYLDSNEKIHVKKESKNVEDETN